MIGDKSIGIFCNNCKLDVTFPNFIIGKQKYVNCPRCGCGIFNTYSTLAVDKGQPNVTAPTFEGTVNDNMNKENSGFKLNNTIRFT